MVYDGSYKVMSGKSMSSPLVTAVYALLMEACSTKDLATLQNVLSATAKPNVWFDSRSVQTNILAPVPQQGGGIIQAYDAVFSTVLLNVSSLAFNDSDHFVGHAAFTITNLGPNQVVYDLSHVRAATVYASSGSYIPDPAAFSLQRFDSNLETPSAFATLSFSATRVTIPPGGVVSVTVTPTPPSGLDPGRLPIYSGYIVLNSTSSSSGSLSLPYVGVAGSLYSAPIIAYANDTIDGWPQTYLGTWGLGVDLAPENTTFTTPRPTGPPNSDREKDRNIGYPAAVVTRKLGTKVARLDVVVLEVFGGATVNTTVVLGREIVGSAERYPQYFLGGPAGNEDAFTGMLSDGTVVPEGRYAFLVRNLRQFGDADKVEDWVVEELPGFVLRYQT